VTKPAFDDFYTFEHSIWASAVRIALIRFRPERQPNVALVFTTRSELWKVLFLAPSVCGFFVCV